MAVCVMIYVSFTDMSIGKLMKFRDEVDAELRRRDVCEHGIPVGEFCRGCRDEYRRARIEQGVK